MNNIKYQSYKYGVIISVISVFIFGILRILNYSNSDSIGMPAALILILVLPIYFLFKYYNQTNELSFKRLFFFCFKIFIPITFFVVLYQFISTFIFDQNINGSQNEMNSNGALSNPFAILFGGLSILFLGAIVSLLGILFISLYRLNFKLVGKKAIFFIILIVSMILSNPSLDTHRTAVLKQIKDNMSESSMSNNKFEEVGKNIALAFGQGIIDRIVSRQNYYLLSITTINWKGVDENIGVGIFGNVWIFKKFEDK